jgi:hypothetical protein
MYDASQVLHPNKLQGGFTSQKCRNSKLDRTYESPSPCNSTRCGVRKLVILELLMKSRSTASSRGSRVVGLGTILGTQFIACLYQELMHETAPLLQFDTLLEVLPPRASELERVHEKWAQQKFWRKEI